MKIGIVGSGFVGATAASAMVTQGIGQEIVLVDKDEARARGEAEDILDAVPYGHAMRVRAGDYQDLAGSRAVIIDLILHDHRAIMTVCTAMAEVVGVSQVTISLPHLVGGRGSIGTFPLDLNGDETAALRSSAQVVRTARSKT